jgi:hypothetical protein
MLLTDEENLKIIFCIKIRITKPQWVGKKRVGNYFTTLENGTAKNLRISYEGRTL